MEIPGPLPFPATGTCCKVAVSAFLQDWHRLRAREDTFVVAITTNNLSLGGESNVGTVGEAFWGGYGKADYFGSPPHA